MTTQPEALRLADYWNARAKELQPWIDNDLKKAAHHEEAAAELRRLHAVNEELLEALEKLARLGNGEHYGNSDGNMIARAAIAKAGGEA